MNGKKDSKGAVISGPPIDSVFENHMAVLLSKKYQDELKLTETPRGKSFGYQNKDAVDEILAGVIAYKLSLTK
jgi:hypothetical protein